MSPVYIDPDRKHRFSFPQDEDASPKPVMLIRVPTASAQGKVQALMQDAYGDGKGVEVSSQAEITDFVCREGWCGVEDWLQPDGKPVEFETDEDGKPTERQLTKLSLVDRMVLMSEIVKLMRLSGADSD